MDISDQMTSSGFIKVPDLANGPERNVIDDVRPGRYERPDLFLQGGRMLSLNVTNMRALASAWGTETDAWIGKEVELYVGKIQFQGQDRDSVLVRAISPAIPLSERAKAPSPPKQKLSSELNDDIPF
jgi:hypothetical protein